MESDRRFLVPIRLKIAGAAWVALAFSLCALPRAQAEYRVFQLLITDTQTNQSRVVVSNLDDTQYPGYHPLRKAETIAIQDSWMCWKRSDYFQPYCPNPRAPASVSAPPAPAGP